MRTITARGRRGCHSVWQPSTNWRTNPFLPRYGFEMSSPDALKLRQIDAHVGGRLRVRREALGLSQQKVAELLGAPVRQIQEYEAGSNRVPAAQLFDLSRALQVPISFFYGNAPTPAQVSCSAPETGPAAGRFAESQAGFGRPSERTDRGETVDLVRAYYRISDPVIRKQVIELMKSLSRNRI
jgi:transcriptional regulator with XRE-family HTH domain